MSLDFEGACGAFVSEGFAAVGAPDDDADDAGDGFDAFQNDAAFL